MTHQKTSKKVMNINDLGDNWLTLHKMTTSQFNGLEIDNKIDYILIRRLKFDSKLDNISPFIKKIYIQSVKFDDYYYNEQTFDNEDFNVFKNNKENLLIAKSYNFFERRYQPFFRKFIKCPFDVQVKHYQESFTFYHAGKRDYFNDRIKDNEEDAITIKREEISGGIFKLIYDQIKNEMSIE